MSDHELQVQQKREVQHSGETTKPEKHFVPAVDIFENDAQITVIAEMPGVSVDGVDVCLEDDLLTIRGARQADELPEAHVLLQEYETGHYLRRFTLAETIDQENIKASLDNGLLTVILPKTAPAKPKKIEVKAA
jgi:HSP20 family protein